MSAVVTRCDSSELTIGLYHESMNITERAEQLDARAVVAEGHGDDVTMHAGHLDLVQGFRVHLDHQRYGGGYVLIRHPGTSGCPAPRPFARCGGHLFTNLGMLSLTSLPSYVGVLVGVLVDANEVGQARSRGHPVHAAR
jgi:hypothetical protein